MKPPLLILCISVMLIAGCDFDTADPSSPIKARPQAPTLETTPSSAHSDSNQLLTVLEVPPEKMRAAMMDSYRLRPDRRFLMAVGNIHQFFTGAAGEVAKAEFVDGRWTIYYRNERIGTLPEFPDFKDAFQMLSAWSAKLSASHPLHLQPDSEAIAPDKEIFWAPLLIQRLRYLDKQWSEGNRSKAVIKSAARSLVYLSFQSMDRMGVGDELPAKALSMLAIAQNTTQTNMNREQCLLSYFMGYSSHAVKLSENFSTQDAIRAYVKREDEALQKLAKSDIATDETRYLYLARLAERGDASAWAKWIASAYSSSIHTLPVLKTGLALNDFRANPIFAFTMPYFVTLNLMEDVGMPRLEEVLTQMESKGITRIEDIRIGSDENFESKIRDLFTAFQLLASLSTSSLLEHFDSGLERLSHRGEGIIFGAKTYQAYYQGYFYSAIGTLGTHFLDRLSSVDATNFYAALLGSADSGIAGNVLRWYRCLAKAKSGEITKHELRRTLKDIDLLGAPAMSRIFDEVAKHETMVDANLFDAARYLASKMDSRNTHRKYLADIAYQALHDMKLTESLLNSVLAQAQDYFLYSSGWYAFFVGDAELLETQLNLPNRDPDEYSTLIYYLEKFDGIKPSRIDYEYRNLISRAPMAWAPRSQYAKYLERNQRYSEAARLVKEWLEQNNAAAGFDYIFAKTSLAGLYGHLGNPEEGLAEIEDVTPSMQAGAMEQAARLLDQSGRRDEAEIMARAVVDRYPDVFRASLLLAQLYWKHGKYDDAAEVITGFRHPIDAEAWRFEVGKQFKEVFLDRPEKEALEAFASLQQHGVGHFDLMQLAIPLGHAGKHELAYKMLSQLRWKGLGNVVILSRAYEQLKEERGKETALEWLDQRVPVSMRNPASMIFYREKADELLWELIENPAQGDYPEFVWLMRAAAAARNNFPENARLDQLLAHYESASEPSNDYYYDLGRLLLGLTTEQQVLKHHANTAKKRCEIAYYIGLQALGEGRFYDASDWFRVSMETGQEKNGEYRWSYDQLYRWYTEGKSLARIALEDPA